MENDSLANDVKTPTVQSLIDTAGALLNRIDSVQLAVLLRLRTIAPAIVDVFSCILALKPTGQENYQDGWRGAQVMIRDRNFLNHLRNYPNIMQERCSPRLIRRVNQILNLESDQANTRRYLVGEKGVRNVIRIHRESGFLLEWVQTIVQLHNLMPCSTESVQMDSEEKNN